MDNMLPDSQVGDTKTETVPSEHLEEKKDTPQKRFKSDNVREVNEIIEIKEPLKEIAKAKINRYETTLEEIEGFREYKSDILNRVKGVWVIENLTEIMKELKNDVLKSPVFGLPNGNKMHMELHLNTRAVKNHKAIGLYFYNHGPVQGFKASLTMYVKNLVKRSTRNNKKEKYINYLQCNHSFDEDVYAWGNSEFISISQVKRNEIGKTLRIQFIVKSVRSDKELPKDSASGLINHGTTCYANSMLQVLNSIKVFRRAVWAINTTDNEVNTTEYALQRVFYNMNMYKTAVSAKELLYTLGWEERDLCLQRDIQEFKCLLCGILERSEYRLNNTQYKSIFKRLIEGKMTAFMKCTDIDYKNSKTEDFADLSLDVRGCADVYESFDKYVNQEVMSGDNSYQPEGKGSQKAYRNLCLDLFPPILFLHLKRFDYKGVTLEKINDHYKFDETLELSKYCTQKSDNNYKLHAVIVHKGSPQSGHYFAFIKHQNCWVKYDDRNVISVESKEAIEDNYGGEYETILINDNGNIVIDKKVITSSAYMLVYIKIREYKEIQEEILIERDIPRALKERFEDEKVILDAFNEDSIKKKASIPIYVTTIEMIKGWNQTNLGPGSLNTKVELNFVANPKYRLKVLCEPNKTLEKVLDDISVQVDTQKGSIEVWLFEVLPYGFNFLPRKKCELDVEIRKYASSGTKVRGLFLVCQYQGQYKELCQEVTYREQKAMKQKIEDTKRILINMKRKVDAENIEDEIPYWKLNKSISHQRTTSIALSTKEENERLRLTFVKYCDLSKSMCSLVNTLVLPYKTSISFIKSYIISELGIDEIGRDVEVCEEVVPPGNTSPYPNVKELNLTDTAEKLKEGTIVICYCSGVKGERCQLEAVSKTLQKLDSSHNN